MRVFGGSVAVLDCGWAETRGRIVDEFDHGTIVRSMIGDRARRASGCRHIVARLLRALRARNVLEENQADSGDDDNPRNQVRQYKPVPKLTAGEIRPFRSITGGIFGDCRRLFTKSRNPRFLRRLVFDPLQPDDHEIARGAWNKSFSR
jgi:hypothetical protein